LSFYLVTHAESNVVLPRTAPPSDEMTREVRGTAAHLSTDLYWSRRGEVACLTHSPAPSGQRWSEEGWSILPSDLRGATRYQCQHCADSKTPIVHRRLNTEVHRKSMKRSAVVLLVDDFEDGLQMYGEYLTYRGFDVRVARSGDEAVSQARRHRPDVVLLDVRMPGMTGTQAMRILRADSSFRSTPIVALTAHALDEERRRALGAGFDAVITKPCLPDELVTAVERVLANGTPTS
jgi:CheY-like chemotaxis protein